MLQPSSHHITAALKVSPEGIQGRNRMPAIWQPTAAVTRCGGTPLEEVWILTPR